MLIFLAGLLRFVLRAVLAAVWWLCAVLLVPVVIAAAALIGAMAGITTARYSVGLFARRG